MIVLVTGCSTGIGLHTAVAAAQAGWTVVATMRDLSRQDALLDAASSAGVEVDVRRLDVTSWESIQDCMAAVVDKYGRLDAVVNNAGVGNTVPTIEMASLDAYRANIEVNFFGVVAMTKAALPHLRASRGRVVTLGSTRGLIGQPFNEAYSAAKFAVEGFLESLAPTAAGMGVTVTIVEPGPVLETAFGANTGITRDSLIADCGPYTDVLVPYLDWVASGGYPGAQTAREVAEVVVESLSDPRPPLRVLTSTWAKEYASRKLADVDGSAVQTAARSWLGLS
ncbi:NAD(P)-dependent dehydrogenase (short-subunit alcohol dehydrogenase family) [Hamadaea flava]|uniref:SDR family NAD(P)-dependent oxidoreductase n=1 Tax=Hamadaea flava TaxID=1742688 RepID=A0ABV8LQJ3_9ACTN|nr:SDR family NAD(P)-dependent oxidoreductase [Hamadaea flava]MCP2322742.1 NAD(P)-dependent dehydrogenase (short-subunit alcohol dehydrogenase family) [Hamadaea flava]